MAVPSYKGREGPPRRTTSFHLDHHHLQLTTVETFGFKLLCRCSNIAIPHRGGRRRVASLVLHPESGNRLHGLNKKNGTTNSKAFERGSWLDAWVEAPSPHPGGGTVQIPFFTETDLKYVLDKILEIGRNSDGEALLEAQKLQDSDHFWRRVYLLADLMAFQDPVEAIQTVRQSPGVMLVPPGVLAQRLVELRLLLPGIDLHALLRLGPWLLLEEDLGERVEPALTQLQALMPGLRVVDKLAEGAGLWWSFADLVRSGRPPPAAASDDAPSA
eukprot:jgi/Botrbrau1/16331/Bobra.0066s0097.2